MKTAWSETTVQLIDDIYEVVEKSPNVLEGLSVEKMSRFAHTLIKIISLQMDLRESVETMAIPTVLSWNLLYRIVKHEEDKVRHSSTVIITHLLFVHLCRTACDFQVTCLSIIFDSNYLWYRN